MPAVARTVSRCSADAACTVVVVAAASACKSSLTELGLAGAGALVVCISLYRRLSLSAVLPHSLHIVCTLACVAAEVMSVRRHFAQLHNEHCGLSLNLAAL